MKRLTIHEDAEAEVDEAVRFYEGRRPGLGKRLREDIEKTFTRIMRSPSISVPIDDQGMRKVRLRRFPYTVYYVELDRVIWVAAVAHQKRRPGYWSQRGPS